MSPGRSPGKRSRRSLASKPDRYWITFKPSAAEALASLSRKDQRLVARRISALAEDPRPPGVEKLKAEQDLYRVRSGDHRVIYKIEDAVLRVLVVKIGNRKDVYRGL